MGERPVAYRSYGPATSASTSLYGQSRAPDLTSHATPLVAAPHPHSVQTEERADVVPEAVEIPEESKVGIAGPWMRVVREPDPEPIARVANSGTGKIDIALSESGSKRTLGQPEEETDEDDFKLIEKTVPSKDGIAGADPEADHSTVESVTFKKRKIDAKNLRKK